VARALPAPSKLHLFYATEAKASPHPMGWQLLLPMDQIVIVPVPGTHSSVMEPPHIQHLGRAVSEALMQSVVAEVLRESPTVTAPTPELSSP
jgi:arthrofactin-type cyclic lipopeptide synthetase C